ncbi:MAG: hypothetical protein ACRC5H_03040 [Treponemataceae bacterium]
MNQATVKDLLLSIHDTQLDFSLTFTGKESKKVNGLYKPDTHEILLHNKNFKSDNQMIYTAIHEYVHHIQNEKTNGLRCSSRVHTNDFWVLFHTLLEKAEKKGIYILGLEDSPELEELTQVIKKDFLEQNGKLMIEFGKMLAKAHKLCQDAHIRYEDYIDRILCLPRTTARDARRIANLNINPQIGFENMKVLSTIQNIDKRSEVEQRILQGKSPDLVRSLAKRKAEDVDQKVMLQKEKNRLEKTIQSLQNRLEEVEKNIAIL